MPNKPTRPARALREAARQLRGRALFAAVAVINRLRVLRADIVTRLMPRSLRRTLVGRLLALLLAGIVIVYAIAAGGIWWVAGKIIDDSLQKQAAQWVAEFDELGTPLYVSSKGKSLVEIEKNIRNFPEILFVRYYDRDGGAVLAEFARPAAAEIPAISTPEIHTVAAALNATQQSHLFMDERDSGENYARVVAPLRIRSIESDGLYGFDLDSSGETVKTIGYMEFGMDYGFYRDPFMRAIAYGGAGSFVLFLLTLAVGRRVLRKALAPLTELQVPLARLARGETDVSVASSGDVEIAAISEALNATIASLKERDATLRALAEHDALTGLANRIYFSKQVERAVETFARDGGTSAILFIDLDQFKYVNDALGHACGDRLLVQVAGLLRDRLREDDVIARFGGDEFTVLARDTDLEGAQQLAHAINTIMQDYCFIEGDQKFNVYCSIGIAMINSRRFNAEEYVAQADMACYTAKSAGRNRYHVFEVEQTSRATDEKDIGWAQRIKELVREDRLELYYQPIVSTGKLNDEAEYYEVLLRMPGRQGELILPGAFLPVARRFGLLMDIDRWVINHALKAMAGFRAEGRAMTFSINLSGQAFEDNRLVRFIRDRIEQHDVPASSLIFEITEQVAVRHMDSANGIIRELTELGCRFALDDFGVGFSSFNYLKHLPVEFLKIDGSFVMQMHRNPIDQAMVRAIIEIARVLKKKTIVESVECREVLVLLQSYGADYVQGRYIGEPVAVPEQLDLKTATA